MSKSKPLNELLVAELEEEEDEVLSTEITKNLQIDDDFVWIGNTPSEIIPREDNLDSSSEADAEIGIAQHGTITENSESTIEYLLETDAEDAENRIIMPFEWEKEVLVDQQYWDQHGSVTQKENSSRIKYPVPQRLTVSQSHYIENGKTINRDPSYYKLGISTTATLKTLLDKKYMGPLHNVVGRGESSVVIHASYPSDFDVVRTWSFSGNAVKVYKLTNDVKKNIAILKRAEREYEHLLLVRGCGDSPCVIHKVKNVLIFIFVGDNQETASSISSIPSEHYQDLYQRIVNDMNLWYTKCHIVHGKLCTKNILFRLVYESYHHTPYLLDIIGWGHSVKRDHPRALIKLMRDCYFVSNFFKKRDVPVKSTEELFKYITGLDKISGKVLDAIHKKDLWLDGHLTNPNR